MTRREILEKIEGHHQKLNRPCDCLHCRKGGTIDRALSELKKLDLTEEEILELIRNIGIAVNDEMGFEVRANDLTQAILSAQKKKRGETGVIVSGYTLPYWCKFCEGWHIGHSKNLRERGRI